MKFKEKYAHVSMQNIIIYNLKHIGVSLRKHLKIIDYHTYKYEIKNLKGKYLLRTSFFKGGRLDPHGIGIALDLSATHSLAQVGRDFIDKLQKTDIAFAVYDLNNAPAQKIDQKYRDLVTDKLFYKTKLICTVGEFYKEKEYQNVVTQFWEFESGMPEVLPYVFDQTQAVMALSDFCYQYFKKIIPSGVKLYKVKYPFVQNWKIRHDAPYVRQQYGIDSKDFVVYFSFAYSSCYERKNPEAVVDAFKIAFEKNPHAKLLIKTNYFKDYPEKVEKLLNYISSKGILTQCIVINDVLERNQMMELMNACDVFISLHRGEGLGLHMMEAMALGKPVIATNYGGNTEFMNKDNSYLVDYTWMKPQNLEFPLYAFVQKWADPDIAQAANYLCQIYKEPLKAVKKALKGKDFVFQYFNIVDFKKQILNVIDDKENS